MGVNVNVLGASLNKEKNHALMSGCFELLVRKHLSFAVYNVQIFFFLDLSLYKLMFLIQCLHYYFFMLVIR